MCGVSIHMPSTYLEMTPQCNLKQAEEIMSKHNNSTST